VTGLIYTAVRAPIPAPNVLGGILAIIGRSSASPPSRQPAANSLLSSEDNMNKHTNIVGYHGIRTRSTPFSGVPSTAAPPRSAPFPLATSSGSNICTTTPEMRRTI
jgi:hypothetical protein